jgi:hypothetical protein
MLYLVYPILPVFLEENPETIVLGIQDTGQINVRENQRGNQDRTIQKHW